MKTKPGEQRGLGEGQPGRGKVGVQRWRQGLGGDGEQRWEAAMCDTVQ